MERNLFRRVEVAFPLLDKKLRDRVIADIEDYLADSAQSWLLRADGSYVRPEKMTLPGIQQKLMEDPPA